MSEREFTAASFNEYLNEGKFVGSRCKKCGTLCLPPRPLCTKCQSSEMEWFQFKGQGKLAAFTTISVGPTIMVAEGFDRVNPYCSGIVELEEGPKISARIVGIDAKRPENIKVGTRMTVEFQQRCQGDVRKTYLGFRPV